MTSLVAGALVALALGYSFRVFLRCRALSRTALTEQDPLELRLAEKELALQLALGRRLVRALGRVTLFAGTGLSVWALTGGSAHYPPAAISFLLGFVGWAGCSEIERRLPKVPHKRPHGRLGDAGDREDV